MSSSTACAISTMNPRGLLISSGPYMLAFLCFFKFPALGLNPGIKHHSRTSLERFSFVHPDDPWWGTVETEK